MYRKGGRVWIGEARSESATRDYRKGLSLVQKEFGISQDVVHVWKGYSVVLAKTGIENRVGMDEVRKGYSV
jgi:hypothetical protein